MVSRIRSFVFLCRLEEEEDRSLPRENLEGDLFEANSSGRKFVSSRSLSITRIHKFTHDLKIVKNFEDLEDLKLFDKHLKFRFITLSSFTWFDMKFDRKKVKSFDF